MPLKIAPKAFSSMPCCSLPGFYEGLLRSSHLRLQTQSKKEKGGGVGVEKKRKEKAKVNKTRKLVGLISVKLHCFQLELTVAINKTIEMGKLLL